MLARAERWVVAIAAGALVAAAVVAVARVHRDRPGLVVQAAVGAVGSATTATAAAPDPATSVLPVTTIAPAPAPVPTAHTGAPAPRPDPNRRWAVGVVELDLVDTSRSTAAASGQPGRPSRHLPTVIRYPVDGAASDSETIGARPVHVAGPFPLVVFAHGYNSSPVAYTAVLHAWTQAGYVVAAPFFPLTTAGGPLDENDIVNQPRDLSFVISGVVAHSASRTDLLGGIIDPSRIAAAGHSDGGNTIMGVAYNGCCQDGRLRAGIVMAGCACNFPGGSYFIRPSPPILVAQGDRDPINDPSLSTQIYEAAPAPKFDLTLLGGGHLEPFTTDLAHLRAFEAVSIDFLDEYLKGRADGLIRLHRDAAVAGSALRSAGG